MPAALDAQLPALQVVVPLTAALLAALFRRPYLAWALAVAAAAASAAIAGRLLWLVATAGPVSYAIGGWARDVGIEYRIDILNGMVLLLVSAVAAAAMPLARRSVLAEIGTERAAWFYTLFLLCLAGLLGIAITGDAFNAFVFLEVSSLASYGLIALGRDRKALLAAYQYLILGTIGATFYVIGVGLLYTVTGTLNLGLMAERLAETGLTRPVLAGLAFIVVGISLKLALWPLHAWLPNAYAHAPSLATLFLAASATKVAIYLLIRWVFGVFGASIVFGALPIGPVVIALSVVAMFVTAAAAIAQADVKRLLAFSSLGQIGYITLGLGMGTKAGLSAALVHLVNHALIKAAAFAAVAALVFRTGATSIAGYAGLGRLMPLTMAALVVAGLGLIGVPGTAGFVSKWLLVTAAIEAGETWLAFLVVGSSLLAIVYVGRVVEAAYFRPHAAEARIAEAPPAMLVTIWLLAGATIALGIDTDLTAGLADRAADAFFTAPPE